MQSKVHPTYKTKYRVANWAAYNKALVRRGDVTVWLSSDAIAAWTPGRSGRRGGQRRYSDLAIETALTLRLLYHLPLRQAEGQVQMPLGLLMLIATGVVTVLYALLLVVAERRLLREGARLHREIEKVRQRGAETHTTEIRLCVSNSQFSR